MCGVMEQAVPIVRAVAARSLPMFAAYRHIDREDLLQHALCQVHRKLDHFDSQRSSPQTWVYMVARFALIDLARQLGRQRRNDALAEPITPEQHNQFDAGDLVSLARMARRTFRQPRRRGRPRVGPAVVAAVCAIASRHRRISLRAIRLRLVSDPDLLAAIGGRAPAVQTIWRIITGKNPKNATNTTRNPRIMETRPRRTRAPERENRPREAGAGAD